MPPREKQGSPVDETTELQAAKRSIALMVYPAFQIQDLSGPLAAFEMASRNASTGAYELLVVSEKGGPIASSSGLEVQTRPIEAVTYDTFMVMGGGPSDDPADLAIAWSDTARLAAERARRIASVCTGAFILAGAGLLNGRRATTHWRYTTQLQRLYPKIKVRGDSIYTKDGEIWTSAGVSAGIDLALAMIEEDVGVQVARATAQSLVVYYRRPGGQSQFSALLDMQPVTDRIRDVLSYIREHLTETLSIDELADVARLSPRQFNRVFQAETGETPAKAVERVRAEIARPRIEGTSEPVEIIARDVGFSDPERMRRACLRTFGHPPQSMRRIALDR